MLFQLLFSVGVAILFENDNNKNTKKQSIFEYSTKSADFLKAVHAWVAFWWLSG